VRVRDLLNVQICCL